MAPVSYKDYCCEGQPADKEQRPDSKWVVLGELPVKEAPMAFSAFGHNKKQCPLRNSSARLSRPGLGYVSQVQWVQT